MPKQVEIGIFLIAETQVRPQETKHWLEFLGADEFQLPRVDQVTDAELLVGLAAKGCYKSFEVKLNPNLTRIREDWGDYLANILRSGHGSVCEHAYFSFGIEGVSRVFTAEMNRHRAGWAISERSLRFVRFDEIPFWMPTSLREAPDDNPDLRARKRKSRSVFLAAFKSQEIAYKALMEIWDMEEGHHNFGYKKKVTSMMRRIIGMGVATGGVWTGNIRALRHVMEMRCSPAAEEEILWVFSRIATRMVLAYPKLFGDFHQDDEGFWRPVHRKV